jgi:hypothetical protein
MPKYSEKGAFTALIETLEADLQKQHGSSILTGEALRQALGYRSIHALRKALERGTVPVDVFTIENRRGRFALTRDVARWLAEKRASVPAGTTREKRAKTT